MADVLLDPKHCRHSGGIIITDGTVGCSDCGAEMVWVAAAYLRGLTIAPTERERELTRQLRVKNAALRRIRQYLREVGIE